jgi:hypothetical protein
MEDIWIFLRGERYKRIQENYLVSESGKTIIFNGFFYKLYENYYRRAKTTYNPIGYLHRAIWTYYNGEIPKGYHVHHKDHDTTNNEIQNLEIIKESEHQKYHNNLPGCWAQSEECANVLRQHSEKAKEWHRSEQGREWHRNHAKNSLPGIRKFRYPKKCEVCGKEYQAKHAWQKFCKPYCKTKWRVLSRIDNETRTCDICKKSFEVNKYALKTTCGDECRIAKMRHTKYGVRPNDRD